MAAGIYATQECIDAIEEGDSATEKITEDVNSHLELIEMKWKKFLSLETEIEKHNNSRRKKC